MKIYATVQIRDNGDEFESYFETREEAVMQARGEWELLCNYDRKHNTIEVREYVEDVRDDDCTCFDYDTIEWRLWYAVEIDHEDADWGTGSYDLEEAKKMAEEMGAVYIAVIKQGVDPVCVDGISLYDSFRVSAVFNDGTTVDNDIVWDTDRWAVSSELEEAREWFADREPKYFLVTYYRDGEVVGSEEV